MLQEFLYDSKMTKTWSVRLTKILRIREQMYFFLKVGKS